jgi:hypothetical protein
MSASCVGTCSACGVRRFWLSDTLSLQLDDGSLKCLPHPAEGWACEQAGLTLAQASQRGRLYRETFYVCHHCGREGEIIEQRPAFRDETIHAFSVRGAIKFGVACAVIALPLAMWFDWWDGAIFFGIMAAVIPWTAWRENRKAAAELRKRGLPRDDAPGQTPLSPPSRGCGPEAVIGHVVRVNKRGAPAATGPCCDKPDWRWAGCEREEDRIPCYACGRGVMTISDQAIH